MRCTFAVDLCVCVCECMCVFVSVCECECVCLCGCGWVGGWVQFTEKIHGRRLEVGFYGPLPSP
jgi:hypothetical protein